MNAGSQVSLFLRNPELLLPVPAVLENANVPKWAADMENGGQWINREQEMPAWAKEAYSSYQEVKTKVDADSTHDQFWWSFRPTISWIAVKGKPKAPMLGKEEWQQKKQLEELQQLREENRRLTQHSEEMGRTPAPLFSGVMHPNPPQGRSQYGQK